MEKKKAASCPSACAARFGGSRCLSKPIQPSSQLAEQLQQTSISFPPNLPESPSSSLEDEWEIIQPVSSSITFVVNGEQVSVENPDPRWTVNHWLRTNGHMDVKLGCGEGGCGACTVMLTYLDASREGKQISVAINSCLRLLCTINGMALTTTSGLGNQRDGFHPIQSKLTQSNGSQCGFCSPGMVMSAYSLLQSNPTPSEAQMEAAFDGNLCRCTGYRPILDAAKSFAIEQKKEHAASCSSCCSEDIEDMVGCPKAIKGPHQLPSVQSFLRGHVAMVPFSSEQDGYLWLYPTTLTELYAILDQYSAEDMKLVVGNTSAGIYKDDDPHILVDIRDIPELSAVSSDPSIGLSIGSITSHSHLIEILSDAIATKQNYQVQAFPAVIAHLNRVASLPIRNAASIGGNLMLAKSKQYFPSDLYTISLALGATLTLGSKTGNVTIPISQFGSYSINKQIILSLNIPWSRQYEYTNTYKVALRHVNAHALVNAGFRMVVDPSSLTIREATIAYGNIAAISSLAPATMTYLIGRQLNQQATLDGAISSLLSEAIPDPALDRVAYRGSLVLTLFYKYYLFLLSQFQALPSRLASAAQRYVRPVSSGIQSYTTLPSEYPISLPVPKLTATLQASGEAIYVDDIPNPDGGLYAAFVISSIACGEIASIDLSAAQAAPGYVSFIGAADIPGANNIGEIVPDEELFASTKIIYHGQPIGLVVCDTQMHADAAAKLVNVTYTNTQTPIITVAQAVAAGSFFQGNSVMQFAYQSLVSGDVDKGFAASDYVISGQSEFGSQYAFYMEPQTSFAELREDGQVYLHAATQSPSDCQHKVSGLLGIPMNSIIVDVKRLGGGFGTKGTRANISAGAVAVACWKLRKSVRIAINRDDDMRIIGKRHPFSASYKVGFNKDGTIQAVSMNTYLNSGCTYDVSLLVALLAQLTSDNVYKTKSWSSVINCCKTNIASSTAVRSFGAIQSVFSIENMMDHIAATLNMTPSAVREANFYSVGDTTPYNQPITAGDFTLPNVWASIKQSAEFDVRKAAVNAFNAANRWRKRGIAITPLKYGVGYAGFHSGVLVNIYPADGSVMVTHGGVEIGQGINTKVVQVVAYELGIPMESIKVSSTSTDKVSYASATGASVTSETNAMGAILACDILNQRLQPFKKTPGSFLEAVQAANAAGVSLSAAALFCSPSNAPAPASASTSTAPADKAAAAGWPRGTWQVLKNLKDGANPFTYNNYAAAVSEAEIDVLTGETTILRADIVYDCGISMNPALDVGQIEGAFVMGMGNLLTEEVLYNQQDGSLLSDSTWEYKVPSALDIPIDMRVSLLPNAPSPSGILSSKTVGEPPMVLAISTLFAVKDAVYSARQDASVLGHFPLNAPATVEQVANSCILEPSQFVLA